MVLGILVVSDFLRVHHIEECREAHSTLEERSKSRIFGEHVLVVPPPVGSRHCPAIGNGVVPLFLQQPNWKLVNLHLAERNILLAIEYSRIIGSMDCLVVSRRQITNHYGLKQVFSEILRNVMLVLEVTCCNTLLEASSNKINDISLTLLLLVRTEILWFFHHQRSLENLFHFLQIRAPGSSQSI